MREFKQTASEWKGMIHPFDFSAPTFGAGGRAELLRLGAAVVDDRPLEPRHAKVDALRVDLLADAADAIEEDGAVTALHWQQQIK